MGEGLSVPLPPYLSPPYFAMLSGSLSTQPPASSRRGLWGSWAPGSAIVPAWGGKSGESSQRESGTIKKGRKKERKLRGTASLSSSLFTSKHIRNSPLSQAVISNLETSSPQDTHFQFSQQLWILGHLIFIVSAIFPISGCTLSSL